MTESITEFLDRKTNEETFEVLMCSDSCFDFDFGQRMTDIISWCRKNKFSLEFMEPADPIEFEGEQHPNVFKRLNLWKFTKINQPE